MAVGELASTVPISRPAVSQHLRVLQDAGLVRATAVGTRRLYSVDPAGAAAVRGYWERFWATALEHFADSARGMVTGPEPENEEQSDGRDG